MLPLVVLIPPPLFFPFSPPSPSSSPSLLPFCPWCSTSRRPWSAMVQTGVTSCARSVHCKASRSFPRELEGGLWRGVLSQMPRGGQPMSLQAIHVLCPCCWRLQSTTCCALQVNMFTARTCTRLTEPRNKLALTHNTHTHVVHCNRWCFTMPQHCWAAPQGRAGWLGQRTRRCIKSV